MNNNLFKKQTLLLTFSIILGLASLIISVGYAYYVASMDIKDTTSDMSLVSFNPNLKLEALDDTPLKLCKSYPIKDDEALSSECQPFTFSLSNYTRASLGYYLNLEILNNTSLDSNDIKVAFANCGSDGSKCTSNSYDIYSVGTVEQMVSSVDKSNADSNGYILNAGNMESNSKNIFKIILWQDYDSTADNKAVEVLISAISYTEIKSQLVFTSSFNLNYDGGVWNDSTCSGNGFDLDLASNECKKNTNILSEFENLPTPTRSGYKFLGFYTSPINNQGIKIETTDGFSPFNGKVFYAHWQDTEAPTCSFVKTVTGSADGVTAKVSCTDTGSGCVEDSHIYSGLKGTTTVKVYDKDGNSASCTIPVTQYEGNCVDYDTNEAGGLYCKRKAQLYS